MKEETGFTLTELITTIAIAALLIGIAVPAFQETIASSRLTSAANQFIAALNLARSEAIKRNIRVTVCPSNNQATCTGGSQYEQGWIVFVDGDNNGAIAAATDLIQATTALPTGLTLTNTTIPDAFISYTSSGSSKRATGGFQAGTLTLCKTGYTTQSRRIVIAQGGRAQVVVDRPANGC